MHAHIDAFIKEIGRAKKVVRAGGLYTILTKSDKLQKSNYTKVGLLGEVNCGTVDLWGKLIKDKSYLVRFVTQTQVDTFTIDEKELPLMIKCYPSLSNSGEGNTFINENMLPLQREIYALLLDRKGEGGQRAFPAYFVVVYSDPLH